MFMLLTIYSAHHRTRELAESIQTKLDDYKAENSDLGRNPGVSELIILDRGFDVISPLLHELTYQVLILYAKKKHVFFFLNLVGYDTGFATC